MCVKFTTKIKRTKRRRFAFKEVTHPELIYSIFYSRWMPHARLVQRGYTNKGEIVSYKIGEVSESDMEKTPGIFMYSKKGHFHRNSTVCLLRMEIPVGTKYRLGIEEVTRRHCICAEKVVPLGEAG